MVQKRDEVIKKQKFEIDSIHGRMKRYVLMQDHLYKDFAAMEKNHKEAEQKLCANIETVTLDRDALEKKCKTYEQRVATLSSGSINDTEK